MQTPAQIKQNDVMRFGFAGHEKACYPQKRMRGQARFRHNRTDASPWKNMIYRIRTLTNSVESGFQ